VLHGSTAAAAVESPAVSVVQPPKPVEPKTCGTVELGEADNISFKPDSADFRDPAGARTTLQRLADTMRAKKQKADLMGTTASVGPPAGRVELSAQRAAAVKSVLVDLGIAADTITTRGVGTNWPGHVTDLGPGDVLLPGPAAQNRKVVATLTCLEQ
jgi:OmpA-OmpF porin, OOP family